MMYHDISQYSYAKVRHMHSGESLEKEKYNDVCIEVPRFAAALYKLYATDS